MWNSERNLWSSSAASIDFANATESKSWPAAAARSSRLMAEFLRWAREV